MSGVRSRGLAGLSSLVFKFWCWKPSVTKLLMLPKLLQPSWTHVRSWRGKAGREPQRKKTRKGQNSRPFQSNPQNNAIARKVLVISQCLALSSVVQTRWVVTTQSAGRRWWDPSKAHARVYTAAGTYNSFLQCDSLNTLWKIWGQLHCCECEKSLFLRQPIRSILDQPEKKALQCPITTVRASKESRAHWQTKPQKTEPQF